MSGGVPAGELLPCPFCGSRELGLNRPSDCRTGPTWHDWFVRCYQCHVETAEYPTEVDVVTAWNTRATPTPPIEGRDADVERAREDGRIAGLQEAALIAQTYGVPGGYVADAARGVAKAILARAALQALGERG